MGHSNDEAAYENLALRKAILFVVARASERGLQLTRTKLVKLLFLADRQAKEQLGQTITGGTYRLYWHGPLAPEILEALQDMNGYEIDETCELSAPYVDSEYTFHYQVADMPRFKPDLPEEEMEIIEEVLEKYGHWSLSALLDHVHRLPEIAQAAPLAMVLA